MWCFGHFFIAVNADSSDSSFTTVRIAKVLNNSQLPSCITISIQTPKRTHNKKKVTLKPMSGIGLNCKSSSMNSSQVGHLIPYRLCLLSCQCYLHPVQPSDYWACGRCLAKLLDLWLSLAWRSFSFLLAGLQDITHHAITSNRNRPAPRAFHDPTTTKHHTSGRPTRFAKCGIP